MTARNVSTVYMYSTFCSSYSMEEGEREKETPGAYKLGGRWKKDSFAHFLLKKKPTGLHFPIAKAQGKAAAFEFKDFPIKSGKKYSENLSWRIRILMDREESNYS